MGVPNDLPEPYEAASVSLPKRMSTYGMISLSSAMRNGGTSQMKGADRFTHIVLPVAAQCLPLATIVGTETVMKKPAE